MLLVVGGAFGLVTGAGGLFGGSLVGMGGSLGGLRRGSLGLAFGSFGGGFQVADAAAAEVLPVHAQLAASSRGLVVVGAEVLEHGRDPRARRGALDLFANDVGILVGAHRKRGADAVEPALGRNARRLFQTHAIARAAAGFASRRVHGKYGRAQRGALGRRVRIDVFACGGGVSEAGLRSVFGAIAFVARARGDCGVGIRP